MRKYGKFVYLLMGIKGNCISQVVSGVEIKEGDELNFKGNKLFVIEVHNVGEPSTTLLKVIKIGEAIIVE